MGFSLRIGAALCSGLLLGPGAAALNVRVLVASAPQVTVRVPATAPAGSALPVSPLAPPGLSAQALPAQLWMVGVSGGQLTLNGQATGNLSLYLPPAPGSVVEIAGKVFRGGVQLRADSGAVQAINVVDVEDYLRGVVPAEMPAAWPAAALAAQAVIARTYVAARVAPGAPYDTCATATCQVYGGVAAEKPGSDAAVAATRTQVVAYGGRVASTYFSSDSGGFTASSAEVWGSTLPYLNARPDPFSVGGPLAHWRLDVPLARVQDIAQNYGVRVGALRGVAITRLSESGRPLEITLTGAGGSAKISGASAGGFVRSLGAVSTRVTFSGLDPLTLEGSGSGHGVGLSQYGALGMARAGYGYLYLLGFYYPGTLLGTLSAAGGPAGTQAASPTAFPVTALPATALVTTALVTTAPLLAQGPALPVLAAPDLLAAQAGRGE